MVPQRTPICKPYNVRTLEAKKSEKCYGLSNQSRPLAYADVRLRNFVVPYSTESKTMDNPPCPCCGGALMRIRRRPIDRFLSVFRTVWRFRCNDFLCGWEGNLRKGRQGFSRSFGSDRKSAPPL
jgi:hypothetical protein